MIGIPEYMRGRVRVSSQGALRCGIGRIRPKVVTPKGCGRETCLGKLCSRLHMQAAVKTASPTACSAGHSAVCRFGRGVICSHEPAIAAAHRERSEAGAKNS